MTGMHNRFTRILLLLMTFAGPLGHATQQPKPCSEPKPEGLRIATGPVGGAYERLGTALAEPAAKAGIPLQVCTSEGSIDNEAILSQGRADFGFVQSDNMLDQWFHSAHPGASKGIYTIDAGHEPKNILLVSRLYSERMHLLVAEHSGIYSIANLKGKKVWLGPDRSGSRNLAFEVLRAAGFEDTDIHHMDSCSSCSLQQALDDLSSGHIAALFRTTSVPKRNRAGNHSSLRRCEATAESGSLAYTMCVDPEVRLLSLDDTLIRNLTQDARYCETLIPRNVYPNQNYAVATIGVQALLVTTMASDDPRVKAVYSLLDDNRAIIEERTGSRLDLLGQKLDGIAAEELTSHIHDEVINKLLVSSSSILARRVCVILLILIVLWSLLLPNSKGYETRVRFAACLILLVLLWLALGYALYRTEGPYSVEYRNPWEASWSVLTHYSHGLQTPTMTPAGREIAFVGLGIFVLFVGWLRSALLDGFLDRTTTELGVICLRVHIWISTILRFGLKSVLQLVTLPRDLLLSLAKTSNVLFEPSGQEESAVTLTRIKKSRQ
jgi:TRAP transporter TAXI family solute receptor